MCRLLFRWRSAEFTVGLLADAVVISALRFNREVCGEFTELADAVVTSAHVTAIWLSRASWLPPDLRILNSDIWTSKTC